MRKAVDVNNLQAKTGGINPHTGRPNSAYPKGETQALAYVAAFSRALGLKPTPTEFGQRVVKV